MNTQNPAPAPVGNKDNKDKEQKAKIWMFICLGTPALITFLTMLIFRDAFITLLFLIATLYFLPHFYNKMAGEFDWKTKLAPEIINFTPP